ncbi:glycosyltransferase family 2 protein [Culicoidibacter larvae]|uniref:Glycosyltransferase family 2 protein n=1 Tax=Culicoidibacter larvae TaxID=2579976 RepID=A0A5R8Q9X0_9FIRM|nr:glycosyltransferase family 2 protein [Culicoidibacter larvae]TLG72700.1 glycosyltransferase family 2 protein [Culicoidibacter larvae]
MSSYKVSFIIPTYNREELLKKTLLSLMKQIDLQLGEYEIIVVDDGSTDNTADLVKNWEFLNIKYIYQKKRRVRIGRARNLGAKVAEGEVLIFLDSGIIADAKLGIQMYQHILNYDDLCLAYVLGFDKNNENEKVIKEVVDLNNLEESIKKLKDLSINDMREVVYSDIGDDLTKWPAPWALFWTACFSVSYKNFHTIGGFDEWYTEYGGEDTDFALSAYTKGYSIRVNKKALTIHYPHEKFINTYTPTQLEFMAELGRNRRITKYPISEVELYHKVGPWQLNKLLLEK